MLPPVSVVIMATRHQFIAGAQSVASTRLGFCTPVNTTSGSVVEPPLCWMRCSHSPALVPSPGFGKLWTSVQVSTVR